MSAATKQVPQVDRVPKYRSDAKGKLQVLLLECTDTMVGEMRHADSFIVEFADLPESTREYADYLTDAELKRCFLRALAREHA